MTALETSVTTNTVSGNAVAEIAAMFGDPTRATMLAALMDGRARTAGELAAMAGITAQTASGHLARLVDMRLVTVEKQGRHRYVRLTDPRVAQALEALMGVAAVGPHRHHPLGPADAALREARTCYDHLAGRLGVALADRLAARGDVTIDDGAAFVTEAGDRVFRAFGIDVAAGGKGRRPLCRACLDWSERRHHLAGRLGAGLLAGFLERRWLVPASGRALRITEEGRRGLAEWFDVEPTRA